MEQSSGEDKVENDDEEAAAIANLEKKEARAIASILNAGPIATKDAAALFFLARRVQSFAPFSGVEDVVLASAAELYEEEVEKEEEDDDDTQQSRRGIKNKNENPPSVKKITNHVREKLGVSLTVREAERVAKTIAERMGGTML